MGNIKNDFFDKVRRNTIVIRGFLSCKALVASKISEMVTRELLRLKTFTLLGILSVADLFDGLILLTTLSAAVAKNLLKDSAINEGSLIDEPSTNRDEQLSLLVLFLRIAEDKICQVL